MPTPKEDPGVPTAWASCSTIHVAFPVRCETDQRRAAMSVDEARVFAELIMSICKGIEG